MASGNLPALSYHAQQYRVRIELTRAMSLGSPLPPTDLIQRAKSKLESVKKEGKISFYEIYEDKLQGVWKALRQADGFSQTQTISMTLAAGSPVIDGLTVSNASEQKPGVFVSTTKPLDLKLIPKEWIRATILKLAKDQGIHGGLFLPQMQSAIMRIASGDILDKFHIASTKSIPPIPLDGKVFTVMANKTRSEIVVFIGDIVALQNDAAIENLCNVIRQTMEKMKATGISPMRFLRTEMIACIKSSVHGPERLGVGGPLGVLAAIPLDSPVFVQTKITAKKYLNIKASDDKMTAAISGFDMKLYSDPNFVMTSEFLAEQLLVNQIKHGLTDAMFADVEDAFKKRTTLDKKVVAIGKPAVAGSGPYLHLVYKDAPPTAKSEEIVNIRDAQQRMIVQKGQFVAESRYKVNPEIGMNVHGSPLIPDVGPPLDVTIGEGIQQREPGKFYALFDGLPKFEGGTLTISKAFIHDGDVNLKSGNIYFDGPVEIKGNVDAGALVRVRGPLKIHGSITGGMVYSKEPIEVLESIVTGEHGRVVCATQIMADFIENSRIECDGNIIVNKSLVSSDVVCGQTIRALANDGVIGGGTIMCRTMVVAANIGFSKGARTKFIVGVDSKIMRRVKIRERRRDNLTEAMDRYKNEFRELAQKKESQLTPKHKQLKESIKKKMGYVRSVLDKAEAQYQEAKGTITYNADAMVVASNLLAANCQFEVGGNGVVVDVDTIAAAVCAKRRRDSHICTYDEIKNEVEKKISGNSTSAPAPKKAS